MANVTLPSSITDIDSGAFEDCASLKTVTIPESVTNIDTYTFQNCTSLEEVIIPNGITNIGRYAFYGCSSLKNIDIPNNVTNIDIQAFYGCSSLTDVTIPESVSNIGFSAFYGCTSLKNIAILGNITSISNNMFYNCSSLTSVSIPDSVTSIGNYTFYNCSSLINVNIPSGVTSIGSYTFYGCSKLTSIDLPSNITSIANDTFYKCSNLKRINIPSSITSVGNYAFYACSKLSEIHIDSIESWLNIKYGNESSRPNYSSPCHLFIADKEIKSITIPSSFTKISSYAFRNCTGLTSIIIPNSVNSIENYAFYNCTKLSGITIPNSVTNIGSWVFYNCTNLTNVTIPSSVTSLGDSAFYTCSNLTSVNIPSSITSIGESTFSNCPKLMSITVPDGVTSIGNSAFANCVSMNGIVLPESINNIGYNPFPKTVKIYCYEYSYPQFWAQDHDYTFYLLDNAELSNIITVSLPESRTVMAGSISGMGENVFPIIGDITIGWTSSDSNVAGISENGLLIAYRAGTTTITLNAGGKSAQCLVTVLQGVENFDIDQDIYVATTDTTQVSLLNIEPSDAIIELNWATGNTIYATVTDAGMITGKAIGETTLTVVDAISGLTRTSIIHICYPVKSINLKLEKASVFVGFPNTASAIATTTKGQSYENKLVTFSSSDPSVATVDQQGNIQTKKAGIVTITAAAANGVTASETLTVEAIQHILSLPAHLGEIESEAFAGLAAVEAVRIPEDVYYIADDAFAGSDVIILTPENSYAAQWAIDHGMTVIEESSR